MKINQVFVRFTFFSLVVLATLATQGCSGSPADVSSTVNPLVAEYAVNIPNTGASIWVEFGKDTTYGRSTSKTTPAADAPQPIRVLVAGMTPNTTYHMRAHAEWDGGSWVDQDQTFTTGTVAAQPVGGSSGAIPVVPGISVKTPNSSLIPQPGVELVDLIGAANVYSLAAFVTDLEGNIIWYYDIGPGRQLSGIKLMPNGHFLLNLGTVLREVDLAGTTIQEVSLATVNQGLQATGHNFALTSFHHDIFPFTNGHWIILGNTVKPYTNLPGYPGTTNVIGDVLIDLDPTGKVGWVWSTFDHLDVNRHPMLFPDWTHSNAILYTPNDGNLLLSMRHQAWVIKIDYRDGAGSGNILWRLGNQGDFQLSGGDPSQWFYAQHFPSINSIDGPQIDLTVFDNGDNRVLNDQGDICGDPTPSCYSRATIFQFDESSKKANLAWEYTPGFYSLWGGGAQKLANGNVEFDMTAPFTQPGSQVMEVTRDASSQVVWQFNLKGGGNAYRAYRIPSLYPGVVWEK